MTPERPFERQIAQEIEHEVGPPRAVDALAIVRAARQSTPSWRDRSMFSTTKLVATGATLAAVGLFAVNGGWTGPSEGGPPNILASTSPSPSVSTTMDPGLAAWVHGTLTLVDCCGEEVETFDADGNRLTLRGMVSTGTAEMDDPRLSGQYVMTQAEDDFPKGNGNSSVAITWGEVVIENAEGGWRGHSSGTWDAVGNDQTLLVVYELTGEGSYAGLSAILSQTALDFPIATVAGAIFPGALPPR